MAIDATDWSIDRGTKVIDYIGDDHAGASPTYATVIEFHRWIGGLADDATSSGDDELDITDVLPSTRATDNYITLINGYTVTAAALEHLYDGSLVWSGGDEIADGIVNYGNSDVQIQLMQNGAVLADDWWNFGGGGLNADSTQGISHRFLIKTRTSAADIDGRRLIGTSRTYGNTYSEFKINGTARGNNVLALADASDLNNATAQATVDAYTDVHIDWTDSTTTVDGVNNAGQTTLNVVSGAAFSVGDFIMINGFNQEYKIDSIATNALTLNRNLVDATAGSEVVYILNMGFSQIDVNNDSTNEDYYAVWDRGAKTINQFYEFTKNISRDGTDHYIYGIPGELFRGITHEFTVDTPTGTWHEVEGVSWTAGTGGATGTGQMLAIDSPTAGTKMWIQMLTGGAPGDGGVVTGDDSSATVTINVTVTDRSSLVKTPFVGASTGSAIIGSYGLSLQTTDLAATDKVFDLTNTQITPPNNVTFSVSGVVSTEDYILVGPWDGTSTDTNGDPEVNYNQMALNATLSTDNITTVTIGHANGDVTTIPSDTPSTGYIRVQDDNGFYRKLHYTTYTSTAFTIDTTDGQEDFLTTNATLGNNVWISYLDLLATSTSESFSYVYSSDRQHVIKVRDGGGTPIKEYITSGTMSSTGGSTTAIRTADS